MGSGAITGPTKASKAAKVQGKKLSIAFRILSLQPMQRPPLTTGLSTVSSKGHYALLGCVFLAALGLRLWFGSAWPVQARFWDERYALENPHSIIVERTMKPSRSFYP